MKIKRIFCLVMAIALVFAVCGCSGGKPPAKNNANVDRNSLVKEGTTPLEQGLDFGGKTVTYAIGLPLSNTMKRQLIAFENKYKCKVETDLLGFQDYVQLLASRMAGGKVYDIIQLEGIRFPSIAISNFVEPLEDYITTADWAGADYTKGGFVKDETLKFVWDGHLYAAVCAQGEFSSKVGYFAYNKKIFEQAGADDPRTLYEQGKWDWDALKSVGQKIVKNTDAKLFNYYSINYIVSSNNSQTIDFSDPDNPKANLTSPAHINAWNFVQELATGANPIIGMHGYGDHTPEAFGDGKIAMFGCAVFDLYDNYCLGEVVTNSNAFDKSLDNLGVVPFPLGPDNKDKVYSITSCVYGIGAGKGTSDPLIALAFAKHAATFATVDKNGKYKYSDADYKLLTTLQSEKKSGLTHVFSDGSNNSNDLMMNVRHEITEGGDVAQVLASYNAQVQNCIDITLAQ